MVYNNSVRKNNLFAFIALTLLSGVFLSCKTATVSTVADSGYTLVSVAQGETNRLVVTTSNLFKSSYASGSVFVSDGITVSFDGTALEKGQYYFTTDPVRPSNAVLDPGVSYFTASQETETEYFYAVYNDAATKNEFVSDGVAVTVRNLDYSNNTWVPYLVTTLVLVGVGGVCYFQYYVRKKKGYVK